MRRSGQLALALLMCLGSTHASARVQRFALIIGNDSGTRTQVRLQYALSDAERVYEVLKDLGRFDPVDMVMLRNESADVARRTLISLNDRIRQATEQPDTQAMLVVYYSGHGDAENLQLGATGLALRELAQLVRGSSADFRILILDACRSGSLTETRLKGGRVTDAFALPDSELPGSGLAYLTASSADEDAQESDELKGSFFTQAFVTGLLGAADSNLDGAISLDEVYRYAYDATLRATSLTLAGVQHPTFRYDLSGQGALVLTRPEEHLAERALVNFPGESSVLVLRGRGDGPVVAEIRRGKHGRTVSLPPGHYTVRAHGEHVLYEGELEASPGSSLHLELTDMRRIEYARLVRKGGSGETFAHSIQAAALLRSALANAQTACLGASVGYAMDLTQLGLYAGVSACTSSFSNAHLRATVNAYDAQLRAYHAWDLSRLSLALGLGAGLALFSERFSTAGTARDRDSLTPFVAISAGLALEISSSVFAALDIAGETYFLRLQRDVMDPVRSTVDFALRSTLGLGLRF
jgi:hypothetical protein